MTKAEEIEAAMLSEFSEKGWEDTTETRILFLTGLQDAWNEEPAPEDLEEHLMKSSYQLALTIMLGTLKMKRSFEKWPLFS